MTVVTPLYGSKVTMTMTLASLASDTNLVAGRQSSAVDNKDVDAAIDALVGGLITLGTSPTTGRQVEVWAYGSFDDSTFSGSATGTDGLLTPDEKTNMKLLAVMPTIGTSNKNYRWGPFSIAQAFGGIVPVQWGIWIVHNTGVVFNATAGNHKVEYYPVQLQST